MHVDPVRTSGVRWSWLLAGTFFVGTLIALLNNLNITSAAPSIADDASLPDAIFANFASSRDAWLQDMGSAVLFALGFLALAVLGPILRHSLDKHDARAYRVAVFFLVGGTIGILSQLVYIGVKEVAIAPYYCDCDFADAQLIARGSILDATVGMQGWLTDSFTILFGLAVWAVAGMARRAAWPSTFVRASQLLAVALFISATWDRVAAPLLQGADVRLEYGYIGLGIFAIIAGIGVPLWAWLLTSCLTPRVQISDG